MTTASSARSGAWGCIFSDEEQHNGFYWKADDGESLSTIGSLVATGRIAKGWCDVKTKTMLRLLTAVIITRC
jgi:hypothetical protein